MIPTGKLVKVDSGIALYCIHTAAMDLDKRYQYWAEREGNHTVRDEYRCDAAKFAGKCLGELYRLQEERDSIVRQIGYSQEVK